MNEILIYLLVILGVLLVPLLSILLNYYFERKKLAAETKKIQLQNKITEEITYNQLKTQNKQKEIKGKIEILTQLTRLEEEIKSKATKTDGDQKKLAALETLKKEFKATLAEGNKEEELFLIEKDKKKNKKTKK